MENNSVKDSEFYIFSDKDTNYLIIRDLNFVKEKNEEEIKNILKIKEQKDNFTIVFDFENFSKYLSDKEFRDIIFIFKENKNLNLVIKNCLISKDSSRFYFDNINLNFNILFISDELYSIAPNINNCFKNLKTKKLIIKHYKINSNQQLKDFFEFIKNTGCQELELEDIYIELIIKKEENDKSYNILGQYITFENGKFYIINCEDEEQNELNLKQLKMIDCPLFYISQDTFKNINNHKNILLNIDENSLINPDIITKFKIKDGLSEICYDLDSYILNEDEQNKDYLEYFDYIFDIILDKINNIRFKKIKFKNFDITKYEYITGEALTLIDEKNFVFNKEEKNRKKKYEEFDKRINDKINKNLDKLSDIKELIFDNCSNYFIQLILKFIQNNNLSNKDLEYLKLKKCGNEYFDIKNILSLKIKKLFLFDIPLRLDDFPENDQLGEIENLIIKISGLEHYCKSNNLDFYKTIEILVKLITNEKFNKNLFFEMNALPTIMSFLVEKYLRKGEKVIEEKIIRTYFSFNDSLEREKTLRSCFSLKELKDKNIILRKNNIQNKYYNYDYSSENIKGQKTDFGSDLFNLDQDYSLFFKLNNLQNITFENCLFEITKNDEKTKNNETIINLMNEMNGEKINLKLDIKTLKEIIFKNKSLSGINDILKYMTLKTDKILNFQLKYYLKTIEDFCANLQTILEMLGKYKVTIIIKDIKERKEFFCILLIFRKIKEDANDSRIFLFTKNGTNSKEEPEKSKFNIPNFENSIEPYFLKEKNEINEDICSIFNYYYTSKEENELFGELGKEKDKIEFKTNEGKMNFTFNIEFKYKNENYWDFIYN